MFYIKIWLRNKNSNKITLSTEDNLEIKKEQKYLPPEQEYPLGQQCTPSEQQTAFGKGQHPYSPDESLQQVFPLGHSDWPSGQTTLCNFKAVVFREASMTLLPLVQLPENIKNNF